MKTKSIGLLAILIVFSLTSWAFSADHLVLTEICVSPSEGEFIEIYNPTESTVDLTNYYITDGTNPGSDIYYYNIVTGANYGGGSAADFHVKFPAGATLEAGQNIVVSLKDGEQFFGVYGVYPDYEILTGSDAPDMLPAMDGSIDDNSGLSNSRETIVLYHWDGQTDLVQDIDYFIYGGTNYATDKTGVVIDGPDGDSDTSTYLSDIAVESQLPNVEDQDEGYSYQRIEIEEGENGEGNGLTGHDETSEDFTLTWTATLLAAPGVYGAPIITNIDQVPVSPGDGEEVTISAKVTAIGDVDFVELHYTVESGEEQSFLMQASGHDMYYGDIPGQVAGSTVEYYIYAMGTTGLESSSPTSSYTVSLGAIPIATLQENSSQYIGQEVTVRGIVTIGFGVLSDAWTTVYIQDGSGAGINVYSSDSYAEFVRGSQMKIVGEVDEYNGVLEIINLTEVTMEAEGQPLPEALALNIGELSTSNEGTFVHIEGTISETYYAGGGTNIKIQDTTGSTTVRVWDTAGLDISEIVVGTSWMMEGVASVYTDAPQLLLCYQEDFELIVPDPNIQNMAHSPETPMEDESIEVQATITSEYEVTEVNLIYTLNFAEDQIVAMSLVQGDSIYSGTIPGQPSGAIVNYHIEAGNSNGDSSASASNMVIVGGFEYLPIATIRENIDIFNGEIVTVKGIVTVGSGVIRNDMLSGYMQDESGSGINVFDYDLNSNFVRGNLVVATGELEIYNGVLELKLSELTVEAEDQPVPEPIETNIQYLSPELEGTYLQISGVVDDVYWAGGGTNLTISDETSTTVVRVWDTSGLNLEEVEIGTSWQINGIASLYNNAPQMLLCYQEDLVFVKEDPFIQSVERVAQDSILTVTATITSDIGIEYVDLVYILNFGEEQMVEMTASTDDSLYSAQVLVTEAGSYLEYYVEAGNVNDEIARTTTFSYVLGGGDYIPISTIRNYLYDFLGKTVTLHGVVTVGSGVLRSDMTSAYMQDESGYGINIFDYGLQPQMVRGAEIAITGELELYNDVLELKLEHFDVIAFDQPLPEPPNYKIGQLDLNLEGSYIEIQGTVESVSHGVGGGSNITIRDITGATTVRAWDTSKVDLNDVRVGTKWKIRGIGSSYSGSPQLLLCYDDDLSQLVEEEYENVSIDFKVYNGAGEVLFEENRPFAPDMGEILEIDLKAPADYRFDLEIYDLEGRMVKSFLRNQPGGHWVIPWSGDDDYQEKLTIGMYILLMDYRDEKGDITQKTEVLIVGTPMK